MARKLGPTQIAVLRFIDTLGERGWTKEQAPGNEWRVIDRLETLGLITNRFIRWQGPTYFINDAGRAALALTSTQSGSAVE